jgi:hypothetical protein
MKNTAMILLTLVLSLPLMLQGCTHAAPRSLQFSQNSKDGLVVFQLGSQAASPITFTIARFDVDSGRIIGNSFSGEYYVVHHVSQARHYVIPVAAGNYVVKEVLIHAPDVIRQLCLAAGTVAFKVDAGQQAFLGDFNFDGQTVVKVGADIRAARDAMRDYPGVAGELAPVGLAPATFPNARRLGNEVCGG